MGRHVVVFLLVIALGPAGSFAAPPIEYTIRLHEPQTQMVDISLRVRKVTSDTLDIALPVWRPGRYVVLDLAGTVRGVQARNADGHPLPIEKQRKSVWRIQTRGADEVRIDYRIYANSLGDRTRHVDDTHAFLSGSAVFMYVLDQRDAAIHLDIEAPDDWNVATGLSTRDGNPRHLVAADYDVLVDSPLEIGRHDVVRFDVDDVPHEIVIWPAGRDFDAARLREDFSAIVREQRDVFGDLPYERYVFLVHAGAGASGGTEHLNSTIMQTSREAIEGSRDKARAYTRFLGLVSHEMFHTWNVKRLRPADITPYDYQRENYTRLLWVAEGTTSYYDDLTLARAGLTTPKRYLKQLSDTIDAIRTRPGARVQSLEDSSFDAWIKFNRPSPDQVNSTVSFYSKGALVSFLLDLQVRARTDNTLTLDHVMRTMYEQFPVARGGYSPDDLLNCLEELTESSFGDFFDRYVRGTDPLPLEEAVGIVGLELNLKSDDPDEDEDEDDSEPTDDEAVNDTESEERAYLGLRLRDTDGRTTVRTVLADGPAYRAGVVAGDEVVAMDERRVRAADLEDRLDGREPGDLVRLHLMRRDELRLVTITLDARPRGVWTLSRVEAPSSAQRAAYEQWIGQPWPKARPVGDDGEDDRGG